MHNVVTNFGFVSEPVKIATQVASDPWARKLEISTLYNLNCVYLNVDVNFYIFVHKYLR